MQKKIISSLLIIMAGETIFMLPFLIPRLYRPLLLEAWGLTNTQLGAAFSVYGISAMVSYLIGGPLADKYHPRLLISSSLLITACITLGLLISPSANSLIVTYFFYGISTTLLMWGALIKVTHDFGGEQNRATAMGVLDSGRGLTAAIMSSLLIFLLSTLMTEQQIAENKSQAVSIIYACVSLFTVLVSIFLFWSLKFFKVSASTHERWSLGKVKLVLGNKKVWMLGFVVLSCYCGYKSIDNYSIYLVEVMNTPMIEASKMTSILFWMRPAGALIGGIVADKLERKYKQGRISFLFILLTLSSFLQLALAFSKYNSSLVVFSMLIFAASFAYSLRAVYFAVFGSLNIPNHLIGTTVGIVSVVGFMPDLFFGTLTGYLIDTYPGFQGFSYTFYFTAAFMLIGAVLSIKIKKN